MNKEFFKKILEMRKLQRKLHMYEENPQSIESMDYNLLINLLKLEAEVDEILKIYEKDY